MAASKVSTGARGDAQGLRDAAMHRDAAPRPADSPVSVSVSEDHLAIRTLVAVALLSAMGLAWEIVLTRLASVLLAYHYAFVAVALAVSGLGFGAALVYALPQRAARRAAMTGALAAAVIFPLLALLLPVIAADGSLVVLLALALLPFVALGVAFAAVFRARSQVATLLYGADLVGAALGAGGVILGLDLVGPFGMLFALGAAGALAALLLPSPPTPLPAAGEGSRTSATTAGEGGQQRLPLSPTVGKQQRRLLPSPVRGRGVGGEGLLAVLLLCAVVTGLVVQVLFSPLGIDYAQLRNAPLDKTIVGVLRNPAQHARVIDTRWDAFARTDVVATSDPSRRFVFTDGGAGTYMVRWDGNLASPDLIPLLNDLETAPFLVRPDTSSSSGRLGNVLVIGAGGGIDVLRALAAGTQHVTAVELNAATVATVRAERAYNGNILDRPDVTTVVDDGRHFLARTHDHYDAILLNLVYSGAAQGQGNALAESYIFTTQAFQAYLAHLTPGGRIGVIGHQGLEGLRAFTTGIEALHRNGLSYPQVMRRAALVMTNNNTPQSRPSLMLLQNAPFTRQEADDLQTRVDTLGLQRLYVPFLFQGGFDTLAVGTQSLGDLLQGSDYAIGPTDDDHPFFFDLSFGLPDGLGAALWYACLVALGLIALVFFLREGPDEAADGQRSAVDPMDPTFRPRGSVWALGLTVALLGVGFMCVEVPLVQRAILVLGDPVRALTTVLVALLLGGGVGSLLVGHILPRVAGRGLPLAPLAVAALVVAALAALPAAQSLLLAQGASSATIGAGLLLLPLGLALGMPFPLTLRLAAAVLPGDIALFWSVNALFSVVGSVLAAAVAVQVGFGAVLLIGALCYGLVATTLAFYVAAGRRVSGTVRSYKGNVRVARAARP